MIGTKIYKKELRTQKQLDMYTNAAEWCNNNNAMFTDKGDYYEIIEVPPYVETTEDKIAKLKQELASTDYKCLKWIDGALLDEEYDEVRAYRAELRRQINELEKDI